MSTRNPADFDPPGKWDYSKVSEAGRYGEDDVTYKLGMGWLDGCAVIEDWGCGMGWARNFVPAGSRYVGIDGSSSKFSDVVTNLVTYRSQVDGIFMRHVIEHNLEWRKVLENALASFARRMALIIFTPWKREDEATDVCYWDDMKKVEVYFKRSEIEAYLKPFKVRAEDLVTRTACNCETIFYIER